MERKNQTEPASYLVAYISIPLKVGTPEQKTRSFLFFGSRSFSWQISKSQLSLILSLGASNRPATDASPRPARI